MTSWNVSNLLRDGDALLVWHGVTLLGDDCPALLLLHHLALLLVVSLARENNQARNIEFLFQNIVLSIINPFVTFTVYPALHWCSSTVVHCFSLTALQAGSYTGIRQDQEIFLILNFVTCLANRLWYRGTHIL